MARRPIDAWIPYLDDILALWAEFGGDFRVGGMTRGQVVALRDQLRTTLEKLNALQAQLGLTSDERDRQIADIEGFAVKFRAAVIAQYGSQSSQAARVPPASGARRRPGPATPPPTNPPG